MKTFFNIISIIFLILYFLSKLGNSTANNTARLNNNEAAKQPAPPHEDDTAVKVKTAASATFAAQESPDLDNAVQRNPSSGKSAHYRRGVLSLVILVALFIVGVTVMAIMTSPSVRYNNAIKLLKAGEYEQAKAILTDLALDDDYLDSLWLRSYADARMEYEKAPGKRAALEASERMETVLEYCLKSPVYDEMLSFAEELKPQADEYASEIEAKKEKARQQERANVRNRLPYVGLPESLVDETSLGPPTDVIKREEIEGFGTKQVRIYRWKAQGEVAFAARVEGGKVISVSKSFEDELWDGDRLITNGSYTPKPPPSSSDPYNASDYSSADDFYYDYYNDFFDYEEAEEYWNEYK